MEWPQIEGLTSYPLKSILTMAFHNCLESQNDTYSLAEARASWEINREVKDTFYHNHCRSKNLKSILNSIFTNIKQSWCLHAPPAHQGWHLLPLALPQTAQVGKPLCQCPCSTSNWGGKMEGQSLWDDKTAAECPLLWLHLEFTPKYS